MINFTVKVPARKFARFRSLLATCLRSGESPIGEVYEQWAAVYAGAMYERFDTYSKGGGDWPALASSTIWARRRATKGGKEKTEVLKRQVFKAQKKIKVAFERLHKAKISGNSIRISKAESKYRIASLKSITPLKKLQEAKTSMSGISILRDSGKLMEALSPSMVNAPGRLQNLIPFGIEVGFGGPALHPGGKSSIADIATYHQVGNPNLPQRQIIVHPDEWNKNLIPRMADLMSKGIRKLLRQSGIS